MSIPKPHCCRVLVLICLLVPSLVPASSADRLIQQKIVPSDTDEAVLQTLARRFFALYSQKNFDEWRDLWSSQTPDLENKLQQTRELFSTLGPIELKTVTILKISIRQNDAQLRVAVEMIAEDLKTHRPAMGFGKLQRSLQFTREKDQWKIKREISIAREIAESLRGREENARNLRLEEERDFINSELARELLSQGDQLYQQGNFSAALSTLNLCLTIAKKTDDALTQARAWGTIGRVQNSQGDSVAALNAYQQSLKMAEELNQPLGVRANLNNIGSVYAELGDYELALDAFQKGLKISESLKDANNMAIMLNNLANVYLSIGNYAKSLEHLHRSIELTKDSKNPYRQGIALTSLASIYFLQGNLDLAESYLRQSLDLLKKAPENPNAPGGLTGAMINMGHVQKQKGLDDKALEYYREALELARARNEQKNIALALLSIGEIYHRQKQFEEAKNFYEQCLTIRQKQGNHADQGSVLLLLGRLSYEQQRIDEALQYAERATGFARQSGNPDLLWRARTVAGLAYVAQTQTASAQRAYSEAVANVEELWLQVGGTEQQQQYFFENKLTPYHENMKLLLKMRQPEAALNYAERAKARALLDVLHSGRVNITTAMTAAERDQERQLKDRLFSVNAQVTRESRNGQTESPALENLSQNLRQARIEYEAFQNDLYAAHPDLPIKRGQIPIFKLADATTLIPDSNTALLEYVTTEDKTFLFVLTREASKTILNTYELPMETKSLADAARNFRSKLAQHDLVFSADAERLFGLLLKPAQAQLQGAKNLIIIPDGALWEMPFEALKSGPQRYLIEDYEISRAPSLTALMGMIKARQQKNSEGALLAIGNPDFYSRTDSHFPLREGAGNLSPLPETEFEVKSLAKLYGASSSKVLVGAAASEEEFKSEAGKYRVLHLATHSVLDDVNPMYSHLVLAQSNRNAKEDGLLEAWEIMQLNLHAEMVVLSACETARGRIRSGEGVLGLVWALFVAGVPTTVVSQWKVNSVSASELMLNFHQGLKPGAPSGSVPLTRAAALRQAELKLLRSKQYRHPFYWASFILIGDAF